ncbi:hypothetical protein CL649_00550 [bacterium]|nr:hypothetical protein [bacterium]|tara:strand:+ start:283 stop:1905 length:1623 start_codon:yes stop_codon:yes gene_type:complete
MAYQSLYRRYRSKTFQELVGQEHIVTALKNAVTENRVGHAYLFSGPRGTGKTSTARILGKALNCINLQEGGEPCCKCDSCDSFTDGTSYDLQELDAASNNGVEAVRELISKVALGSPGKTKIYILDEVHMLTTGAENALLKTLEEPPSHVVFILATTEPHKVAPTIRSRTQHYEFELLAADDLEMHIRWIADDAELEVSDEMINYVLRTGGGSARDTLSALEQVVTAGGIPHNDDNVGVILSGVAHADPALVISGLSNAIQSGRDPRVIGEALISRLRDAFLFGLGSSTMHMSDHQKSQARELHEKTKLATLTRAIETIGSALISMRQSFDPSIDLEVALIRLTHPTLSTEISALVERIELLESGTETEFNQSSTEVPLSGPVYETPQSKETAEPSIEDSTSSELSMEGNERVEEAWDTSKQNLKGLSKALFKDLSITQINDGTIFLTAPNETHRQKCIERLDEVVSVLTDRTGKAWKIDIVLQPASSKPEKIKDDDTMSAEVTKNLDVQSLEDAPVDAGDELSVISKSFPGAQIINEDT